MSSTASAPAAVVANVADTTRYEDALAELERLVQSMESGQMPLDKLLDNYRRGAELLGQCRAQLQAVEDQVKVLEDGRFKDWTDV